MSESKSGVGSTGLVVSAVVLGAVGGLTVLGLWVSTFLAAPRKEPVPRAVVGPVAIDPAAFAKGREAFAANCLLCHGPNGEAKPGLGKDIATSEFVAGLSDAELVAFLMEGRSASDPLNTSGVPMPPRAGNPTLTAEDMAVIVPFIRGIQAKARGGE